MDTEQIRALLGDIGLSKAETIIYMALLDGIQSVGQIMKATNEKRPTVYYSLNSLEKRGLVSKTGKEYGNTFQVEPVGKLLEIVDKNIRKQNELLEKTRQLKDFYPNKGTRDRTLVSYFDNIAAIRSAIFYTLYGKGKTIRTIVPADNFFHEVGQEFITEYVSEKKKRGIRTKALWEHIPHKKTIEDYYVGSEIRQLPVDMHESFKTTVFIYDDKTLYISPKKENHAVLIQSKEHVKMMTAIFENIWGNALKIR